MDLFLVLALVMDQSVQMDKTK